MIYELDCQGSELCLRIFQDKPADPETFRIEARRGRASDEICINEAGATRLAALQEVARVWRERARAGFPVIDWEAVAQALLAVRAV